MQLAYEIYRNASTRNLLPLLISLWLLTMSDVPAHAQSIDKTRAPNLADDGIAKSLAEQIGAGRGDLATPNSSIFIINRDPFRSVRRGRQLFQRKFTRAEGLGPAVGDGAGDINSNLAIGAGFADSCAACHGRPRGSGGVGGTVATRPDSRDAPHLFGLGLKEMLADEITADLRHTRDLAIAGAKAGRKAITVPLSSKGIYYGFITASPDGSIDTTWVQGVNADLRVRPFFAHGDTISIHEFVVGALQDEMGLQAVDPDLASAAAGGKITTPSGMVLDGSADRIKAPPKNAAADPDQDGVSNEIPVSLVDHLEFYLLNYFKPGTYEQDQTTARGLKIFHRIGCGGCHIQDLPIRRDRRVGDVETVYDTERGIFNNLFATAATSIKIKDDGSGWPALKQPKLEPFLVRNIFTDFKRHDVGAGFYERDYDGTLRKEFLTTPLWGVGSTAPYGHDGRSINLSEAILRHGGEARVARDQFAQLGDNARGALLGFLNSLIIFPPDDTASNLNPGDRNAAGFPQFGHGSIRLPVLFNDPSDLE
ncbi:MAG: thiol oxidoreductase-like protein [Pseudomonadota bacterium]|nr:thiol oxidoreductase-like protein [Pseudomonadota bacterium]